MACPPAGSENGADHPPYAKPPLLRSLRHETSGCPTQTRIWLEWDNSKHLVFDGLNPKLPRSFHASLHLLEFFGRVPLPADDLADHTQRILGTV